MTRLLSEKDEALLDALRPDRAWMNSRIVIAERFGFGRWVDVGGGSSRFRFYWPFRLFPARTENVLKAIAAVLRRLTR